MRFVPDFVGAEGSLIKIIASLTVTAVTEPAANSVYLKPQDEKIHFHAF